jgi:hypothetical protein
VFYRRQVLGVPSLRECNAEPIWRANIAGLEAEYYRHGEGARMAFAAGGQLPLRAAVAHRA